jgi:hypothetical protein
VYVGTSPDDYSQTFDVGDATSFVYQAPDSRLYYLAVASYAEGPDVGPMSDPVSGYPVDGFVVSPAFEAPQAPDTQSFYENLWRNIAPAATAGGLSRGSSLASRWRPARASITSPAASSNDRLFFIEDGQRIGLIASHVLQPRPVLVSDDPDVRLTQVIPDPDFASTGSIYVGETGASRDGERELRVVRYRVDDNQAVEPALVATVLLPAVGEPVFSISMDGELSVRLTPAP